MSSDSVLIVAAEASSGLYAQRLLELWKSQGRDVHAFGIGTRAMEQLGFEILGRSEELAVVGLQEVIAHFPLIRRTFHSLVSEAAKRKPKFALLLDYPDFNLRLAKKLKALGVHVIYYVSPQIWAWRQSRVYEIKKVVDRMLVLFPFEKDFYNKFGVPADFVGHPLLDEISDRFFDPREFDDRRAKYGISHDEILLALMPGSRRSELKHHLEVQMQTAAALCEALPQLRVALFVAPTFQLREIRQMLPEFNFPLQLIQDEPFEMIRMADVVLCASGTATLMVGLLGKPMVVMYRMNPLTAFLAKRFVKHTAHFGMINLVLGDRKVPELFQEQASVDGLSQALLPFLKDADLRQKTSAELVKARYLLGDKGATQRVDQILQQYFGSL